MQYLSVNYSSYELDSELEESELDETGSTSEMYGSEPEASELDSRAGRDTLTSELCLELEDAKLGSTTAFKNKNIYLNNVSCDSNHQKLKYGAN